MSEIEYCFVSTMGCKGEQCPVFHNATGQCKIAMVINRILGDIDGSLEKASQKVESPLVADALHPDDTPDISKMEWMIKGNKDARDTDSFAYAFVFKYDATAKQATDELRTETEELYNYLRSHDNTLTLDGFVYSLNKTETLFGRNKVKE